MPTPPSSTSKPNPRSSPLIDEWQTADGSVETRDESADLGGTMRLGAQEVELKAGSLAAKIYGSEQIRERHRHRYEVNNNYVPALEKRAWSSAAYLPDANAWLKPSNCRTTLGSLLASSTPSSLPTRAKATRCSPPLSKPHWLTVRINSNTPQTPGRLKIQTALFSSAFPHTCLMSVSRT